MGGWGHEGLMRKGAGLDWMRDGGQVRVDSKEQSSQREQVQRVGLSSAGHTRSIMLNSVAPQSSQQSLFPQQNGSAEVNMPFNLDPYAAKQMALLQATSLAKAGNRSAPGGTSASYFGGMSLNNSNRPDPALGQEMNPSSFAAVPGMSFPAPSHQSNPQPSSSSPAAMQPNHHQRKRQFLIGLANIQSQRGTPLPPQLTGAQTPNYDPSNSPWRPFDVGSEPGNVRLAGKEVDLFKLWALVLSSGGGQKMSRESAWPQVLRHFDLPEHFTSPSGQQQSVAQGVQQIYHSMIGPFEEAYRKNALREQQQQQQRAAMMARAQPNNMQMSGFPPQMNALQRSSSNPNIALGNVGGVGVGGMPMTGPSAQPDPSMGNIGAGQFPPRTPSQSSFNGLNGSGDNTFGVVGADPMTPAAGLSGSASFPNFPASVSAPDSTAGSDFDPQDPEGRKRKLRESEEADSKRVRQKTSGSDAPSLRGSVGPTPAPTQTVKQPSRRKIEYVPLRRELDTHGGRDLKLIEKETNVAAQRPRKPNEEWGNVDVEALTLSLRSRISTELSYGLTTFSMLTVSRGSATGFPIAQAPDLLEEVLDLIEDVAFDGEEDSDADFSEDSPIITNTKLVGSLVDEGSLPFANLKPRQGEKPRSVGPGHRPGDIILAATNILRNLSIPAENHEFLGKHPRYLGVLLRTGSLKPSSSSSLPEAFASVLSLNDLLTVRKDIVYIMLNISPHVRLPSNTTPSPQSKRIARRAFSLLSSYFIDSDDAVGPFQTMLSVAPPTQYGVPPPPALLSTALECFARFCQPDDNRKIISCTVPQERLWSTYEALVHRLPSSDNDFGVLNNEPWLAYIERVMHALYSLSFLAPPKLKIRIKTCRKLRFHKVLLRFIKKLLADNSRRPWYLIVVKRAVETTKLIDACEDSFDTSHSSMPTLTFGMGWGEHGETRVEKGHGLWSGYQEDITWQIMTIGEVDPAMFSDLASLVRIGETKVEAE